MLREEKFLLFRKQFARRFGYNASGSNEGVTRFDDIRRKLRWYTWLQLWTSRRLVRRAQVSFVNRMSGFGRTAHRHPFVGFRADSPGIRADGRPLEQVSGAPLYYLREIAPASHKFSTHFPLRKKNALKKAFPVLRFLELDNMQKVVPESFEFVSEHSYACL